MGPPVLADAAEEQAEVCGAERASGACPACMGRPDLAAAPGPVERHREGLVPRQGADPAAHRVGLLVGERSESARQVRAVVELEVARWISDPADAPGGDVCI